MTGNTPDSIQVNHLAFIQSLPPNEFETGEQIWQTAEDAVNSTHSIIRTYFKRVTGVEEFRQVVMRLTDLAYRGLRPVLHVDAHAEKDVGLHFADGTCLSWHAWCALLADLNRATQFNLLVVVSACYGVNLVLGIRLSHPAPCAAWIGPHDEADPGEILGRFRTFYSVLIKTLNMTSAMGEMQAHSTHGARFDVLNSEQWFHDLITKYLDDIGSPAEQKQSAMRQYRTLRAAGVATNLSAVKRDFRRRLPSVVMQYFDDYFMVRALPNNAERFALQRRQLQAKLVAMELNGWRA